LTLRTYLLLAAYDSHSRLGVDQNTAVKSTKAFNMLFDEDPAMV